MIVSITIKIFIEVSFGTRMSAITRVPLRRGGGQILHSLPGFLDSSKTVASIDAKFSVPSPATI